VRATLPRHLPRSPHLYYTLCLRILVHAPQASLQALRWHCAIPNCVAAQHNMRGANNISAASRTIPLHMTHAPGLDCWNILRTVGAYSLRLHASVAALPCSTCTCGTTLHYHHPHATLRRAHAWARATGRHFRNMTAYASRGTTFRGIIKQRAYAHLSTTQTDTPAERPKICWRR